MRWRPRNPWRDERGAVAATYAIAVLPLIVVAGVGYDYSRMVSLDSELQNAADQAALAAVTQLDKGDDACERASNAAVGLLSNLTMLSNDGGGNQITVTGETECDAEGWIRFYQDEAKTLEATTGEQARFVEVHVNPREAFYALTPVMANFVGSGDLNAAAFAGIGNAICKSAPVMICNPGEQLGDPNFTVENYIGKGLKLVSQGGGSGGWAPGNFGYLDSSGYANGAPGLRQALGWENLPGNCLKYDGVDTKPGANTTVTDSINTRFDIYDTNNSCPSGGACPASISSVKDFRRPANANGGNSCRTHNQGWQLPAGYYGSTAVSATVPLATGVTPTAMGHPRDMCHLAATGACSTPFGNGLWDRDAYFRTNYRRAGNTYWTQSQWQSNTGLGASATRYEVYKWEMDHRGTVVDGVTVLAPNPAAGGGNTLKSYGRPVCSQTQSPSYGTGSIPDDDTPDRRVLTVAAVNCVAQSVNGNSTNVAVAEWIDVFLVEPSFNRARTNAGDVYVEIIGKSRLAGGSAGAQQIVKSTPYLIE